MIPLTKQEDRGICKGSYPISRLFELFEILKIELAARPLNQQEIREHFKDVQVSCVECRMSLAGTEFLDERGEVKPRNNCPKLARIAQGYCARNGCMSYHYELYASSNSFPTEQVLERFNHLPLNVTSESSSGTTARASGFSLLDVLRPHCNLKTVAALILALSLVLLAYFQFRTPAWSTRPSGMKVDPSTALRYLPE